MIFRRFLSTIHMKKGEVKSFSDFQFIHVVQPIASDHFLGHDSVVALSLPNHCLGDFSRTKKICKG